MSVSEVITAAGDRGVLVGYLPVGFPTLEDSIEAAVAIAEAGVDILEIGVPYSDPVMDGPAIAEATATALERGFTLSQLFPAIRAITSRTTAPVVVMTYWNPVVQYGVERFAKDLKDAGGAGMITPDLIPDEAAEWLEVSDREGLERVFLAAPTSTEGRLDTISKLSRGFVYAVSTMGITGTRDDVDQAAKTLVERLRSHHPEHVCVGIGISNADQVRDVLTYADGAIVGSALVKALAVDGVDGVRKVAQDLAAGKRPPVPEAL